MKSCFFVPPTQVQHPLCRGRRPARMMEGQEKSWGTSKKNRAYEKSIFSRKKEADTCDIYFGTTLIIYKYPFSASQVLDIIIHDGKKLLLRHDYGLRIIFHHTYYLLITHSQHYGIFQTC